MINYHKPINKNANLENKNSIKNTDSPILEISSESKIYTEYEPIPVLIKYINNSNKPDNIYTLDDYSYTDIKFIIIDENGKRYNNKWEKPFSHGHKPKYILNSFDTLNFVFYLGDYGELIKDKKFKFSGSNYLPERIYKVNIEIGNDYSDYYDPIVTSNELDITITKYSSQNDSIINFINMLNNKVTEERVDTVSVWEHFNFTNFEGLNKDDSYMSYIYSLYTSHLLNEFNSNKIEPGIFYHKILNLLKTYPNSYYNISLAKKFIYTFASKNIDISKVFVELKNQNLNQSLFSKMLYYYSK